MNLFLSDMNNELVSSADSIQPGSIALAFLGDSVFDLFIRENIVSFSTLNPHQMHEISSSYACAASQAKMVQLLLDDLTEEEHSLVIKARNHKSISPPKNQDPVDYKWATALEALFGNLYLHDMNRARFLFNRGVFLFDAWRKSHAQSNNGKYEKNG